MEELKKGGVINDVKIKIDTSRKKKLFFKALHNWSFNNMGPIVVPKKGMQIKLNTENFALYKRAINSAENSKIEDVDGVYYINDKKTTSVMIIKLIN